MEVPDYFLTKEMFSLLECLDCDVNFTSPQPSKESIASYYRSEEYISHSNSSRGAFNKIYKAVRRLSISQKIRLISGYKSKGSILDIGCGTGHLLHGFKKKGWKTAGIEPNASAAKFAVHQLHLEVSGEEAIAEFPDQCFDVVSMWHVLEHVHDGNERMKQIYRILKDDGVAVVALPNLLAFDAKKYGPAWAAYDVPRHLFHFSPKAFSNLASSNGFTVLKTSPMIFDAYYVSLLSEKYLHGKKCVIKAMINGLKSNLAACTFNKGNFSSLIYILSKSR